MRVLALQRFSRQLTTDHDLAEKQVDTILYSIKVKSAVIVPICLGQKYL
jgi:hypothetical protein